MAYSIAIRELILHQLEDGFTQIEVAENLNISQSTVSYTWKKYQKYGHLESLKHSGREPIYNETDLQVLISIVEDKPDLTLIEYAQLLAKKIKKPAVSQSQMQRIMAKLGFTRKKKSKHASESETPENKKKSRLS